MSGSRRHGPVERYPLFEIVQELAQDSRGVVDALDDNESEKWNQIMREIDSASENDMLAALNYILGIVTASDVTIPEGVEHAWWDLAHEIREGLPAAEQRAAGESSGFFLNTEKGERS
jgi:hypothetical protein